MLWRDGKVVAVLDLDFMEERTRLDDLALVLYYAYPGTARRVEGAEASLAAIVRAYSSVADPPLTPAERLYLPFAIARTCLHFTRHLALRVTESEQRQVVRPNVNEIGWGRAMLRDTERWQEVFAL